MSAAQARDRERLTELLADEASAGLGSEESVELKALLEQNTNASRDEFMRVAALAQVAFLRRARQSQQDRMPAGLRERLATQGETVAIRQRGPGSGNRVLSAIAPKSVPPTPIRKVDRPAAARPASTFGVGSALGWALAAALAVALVVVRTEPSGPSPTPDEITARTSLVKEAADVQTLPWTPPAAEGYQGVRGDVVWSQSRQQGYLRLVNMPVNDPARTQYQLWIVDPDRDSKHPVDGGVFNVSATGEVIIPIQAKLPIRSPKAFAITAEQPGGVVVSAGPLLVVASI